MCYSTVVGRTGAWWQREAQLVAAPWMGGYGGACLPERSDCGSRRDTWPSADEAEKRGEITGRHGWPRW